MLMSRVGVVVIGGGPAGLAAAIAASVDGASVLLVDRDTSLGGTLKQAIHNGFGALRHGDRLTGPEYAFADISNLEQTNTFVMLQTSVTKVVNTGNSFQLTLCNRHGIVFVEAKCVVLATGCIERSANHLSIHGSRPAGVFTAGSAQYYLNILGQLPGKNCIILGSSDPGLIIARRLTLEGARVLGVYEPSQSPAGLLQNVSECLNDYFIPLHCGHTVTHVTGSGRLKSVIVQRVDKNLNVIRGSENRIKCDSLILAGGLIPDTELADSLGIPISDVTDGPICDQNFMTMTEGVFCCGNALFINSMVDYISECGKIAGQNAARFMYGERQLISVSINKDFLTVTPQYLDLGMLRGEALLFFRPRERRENVIVKVLVNGQVEYSQEFLTLVPSEVERLAVNFNTALTPESRVELRMENNI
ncbi:MAG: NAD(P)/FAD-dependent oxidoreductase [Oscillospiraceae bacterium]|nr:NAD(P)/FAD-dependent oxidoreductase [Oscillospiraceae bacterium]